MGDATLPVLPQRIGHAARDLLEAASAAEFKLAVAESCTGGLLAAVLTDVEGYGHVFDRGFVTYSEDAKCELLGVDRALIARCGAVSQDVALAMARCALEGSQADLTAAITGFAGPGGDDEEEGLVHLAVAMRGGCEWHREEHFGTIGRDGVRIAALEVALAMMNNALADDPES
jgi:nicotinamide-nucleotide amidase